MGHTPNLSVQFGIATARMLLFIFFSGTHLFLHRDYSAYSQISGPG